MALMVKYIAKSPAKNISSLESHTMVPTDTMFGRFTWTGAALCTAVAVATGVIMATRRLVWVLDPRQVGRGTSHGAAVGSIGARGRLLRRG
jgi:hypothetical protein